MKNILITGANGFLGIHLCKVLSKKNNVIGVDKKINNLNKIKNKNIQYFKCDITKEASIKKLFQKLNKKFINILINNAAIDSIPKINTRNLYPSYNQWNKEINVSIIGSFLMIKYFGSEMLKNKNGSIINIGSDLSVIAPNQNLYKGIFKNFVKSPTYSVIKHGLLGLTKYYASTYAEKNINVNMLSPSPLDNKHKKSFRKRLINQIPKKKLLKLQDLNSAIEFLISDESKFFTGQNLIVDGGRTII